MDFNFTAPPMPQRKGRMNPKLAELELDTHECFAYVRDGDWEKAKPLTNRGIKRLANNRRLARDRNGRNILARFYNYKGEILLAEGREREALKAFRLSKRAYSELAKFADSEFLIDVCLYSRTLTKITDIHIKNGRVEEAVQEMDENFEFIMGQRKLFHFDSSLSKFLVVSVSAIAQQAFSLKEEERTIAFCRATLEFCPDDGNEGVIDYIQSITHYRLAVTHINRKRGEDARREAREALEAIKNADLSGLDPDAVYGCFVDAYSALGQAEAILDHQREAIHAYEMAVNFQGWKLAWCGEDDRVEILKLLGLKLFLSDSFLMANDMDRQIEIASEIVGELEGMFAEGGELPDLAMECYVTALRNLGKGLVMAHRFEEGIEAFDKWLGTAQENPNLRTVCASDHFLAHICKSRALRETGRLREALAEGEAAKSIAEDLPDDMKDKGAALMESYSAEACGDSNGEVSGLPGKP